eukprot:545569-Pyramimonas_sp.AAC.1
MAYFASPSFSPIFLAGVRRIGNKGHSDASICAGGRMHVRLTQQGLWTEGEDKGFGRVPKRILINKLVNIKRIKGARR